MPVFGLKLDRVWCEFVGQNIFSGLDARGGYGHKDFFFLKSTFFISGDPKIGMGWWKRRNARRELQWSERTLFHLLQR